LPKSPFTVQLASSEFKQIVIKSCSLDGSQSLIENDDLGMGRESLAPTMGRKSVAGDIKVPVDLRNMGIWLTGLLGSAVTTEATGVYTHVFSSGKSILPSFTVEKSFKEVADFSIFNGCKIGNMDFDFQADGNAAVSMGLTGQGEENSDISVQPTPAKLVYKPFSNAQGFVNIDGAEVEIMSASLSLNNNLSPIETIRSDNKIGGIETGMFNATGSVSVKFTNKDLLNKAIAGTPVSMSLGFKFSDTEKMTIKVLEAYISKPGKAIDGPGGIELSFDFQGAKNVSAGKMVEVELINDVESY